MPLTETIRIHSTGQGFNVGCRFDSDEGIEEVIAWWNKGFVFRFATMRYEQPEGSEERFATYSIWQQTEVDPMLYYRKTKGEIGDVLAKEDT